jgi:predicted small metal-binding protein
MTSLIAKIRKWLGMGKSEEVPMKQLRCSHVGFDCQHVIQGEDEQEVMSKAADHAREAHGMTEIDEETGQKLRSSIHDAVQRRY